MKKIKITFLFLVIIIFSISNSCTKFYEENEDPNNDLSFQITISDLVSSSKLKSLKANDLENADRIVFTIQKNDGSPTQYTSSEVKIEQMNGIYYTKKIILKTGDYKLIDFVIVDKYDSTIFASPLTGSKEAQNVTDPLPIEFSIEKNLRTPVNVEVLSTEKKEPEDFGLVRFPIIEVKTFSILIGIVDKFQDNLLNAKIIINNGSYSYTQNLDSISNNVVTIKELNAYSLVVEKNGYITYTQTFSNDSLKRYSLKNGNTPLLIEIEQMELLFEKSLVNGTSSDIYTMNFTGNKFIRNKGTMGSPSAIWSVDKKTILYSSDLSSTGRTEIFIMNRDGLNNTQITFDSPQYGNTSAIFRTNNKIWYSNAQSTGWTEITEINTDGTNKMKLTNFSAQGKSGDFVNINKDETKICYYKQTSSWSPDGEIYVSNIDFSGEVRLTNNNLWDGYPSFSPDGLKILYINDKNIYTMNLDGTDKTPLTSLPGGYYCDKPVWSPDGNKIAYSVYNGTQYDIWTMDKDGSNKVNITSTPDYNERATDWK